MSDERSIAPGSSTTVTSGTVVIRVESAESTWKSTGKRLLVTVLTASVLMNIMFLISKATESSSAASGVSQKHHSGELGADSKLAIINFSGTIMPPFTERWLKQIKHASEDESVKGVLLAIDSPGGLVADSHQLYHELKKLSDRKPVYVSMKRLAASGGYYIAMAGGTSGRIFAEPTTWTGSIGVIVPRYNASELATKIGVTVEPLVTGPLKDSLNPFRDLSEQEKEVWKAILDDSFARFVGVIETNRPKLNDEQVRLLATGQIYTANQAVSNGLVDEIGFEEDAITALATSIGVSNYETVEYASSTSLIDVLLGAKTQTPPTVMEQLLDASVPRAMYYCSWNPWVSGSAN